jgi:putative ABC transport system permease protein
MAVSLLNFRNLPARFDTVLVALIGFAGVVTVLVALLSVRAGFKATLAATGRSDVAIVLRGGAGAEINSILTNQDAKIVGTAPGVANGLHGPMISPELLVIINRRERGGEVEANVPFRGVTSTAFAVHPKVHIIAGRRFRPGLNEVIVGKAAAGKFQGLQLGNTFTSGRLHWRVVGIFDDGGGLHNSEIWTDLAALQQAYRRGSSVESVYARLRSPKTFKSFKAALSHNPSLKVSVQRETDYYAEQSKTLSQLISVAGGAIAFLMGIGAIFGAINTMYTTVSDRTAEIGTLRALGFGRLPVLASVVLESLAIGLVGGIAGGALAYFLFNGFEASTLSGLSQVIFRFAVTPTLIVIGISYALVMGFIGGILPAIRAARLPIASAIREP